jgi:two-component system response regulator AlgR
VKVLIVDDEPLARTRLVRLLEQHPNCQVVAEAGTGEQAILACNEHSPDVVLMDIRMPVMDGLQAARHLAKAEAAPAVIFCTAYDDYALEAFEANAVDYLLKPVNREKLALALSKAQKLNRIQLSALLESSNPAGDQQGNTTTSMRSHISAKSSRGIELIALTHVRYFLADQKYVTVYHLLDQALKEVLIDDSLKELEQELGDSFVRVHRNALVAIDYIQGLEKTALGPRLKLADVAEGPLVSRRHLPGIRKLLQQL